MKVKLVKARKIDSENEAKKKKEKMTKRKTYERKEIRKRFKTNLEKYTDGMYEAKRDKWIQKIPQQHRYKKKHKHKK